ncbi:rod shape-determining protein MreC [Fluviicola taffensis]|uniref:Cell shape-determining protein MreC n=1 Tax=Fluviicola taffensis (strain DSM 16823 / NCIMB 13979 / RW262) TaxID=755732 RepID=F2IJ15_FLUTR|nr:rod shape-determining protein MreC [Fluviicola taffensis]AEA43873.1 Rod shape-determining protein MreC [Fluviicola taffensis DSM 16823]
MRNLIAFFKRFQIFLVFVFLQVVALSAYVQYSDFARLQVFSSASMINGRIYTVRNSVTKHFNLEGTNRKLEWENARLRAKLKDSNYKIDRELVQIEDTSYHQQYLYLAATVINNTYDKRNNYMTIDIGKNHGIKKGWGVISSKGVVGIVHLVGESYAVVKTILSKNINVDVSMRDGGAFGLLKWDAINSKICQVSGISNDITIKKFTKVVTRGGSGIFPRGIPVGVITKRKSIEGKPLWDLQVRIAEDFRTIQHVYVIQNVMLDELRELEGKIPPDKEEEDL